MSHSDPIADTGLDDPLLAASMMSMFDKITLMTC